MDILATALPWVGPLIFVGMLAELAKHVYAYVCSCWVEGKPNEWVVIMRAGEQVQAGVGLSTFKGPFDQVAIFRSELVKVEIATQ